MNESNKPSHICAQTNQYSNKDRISLKLPKYNYGKSEKSINTKEANICSSPHRTRYSNSAVN